MASSIHAIHRPVARSRRGTPANAQPKGKGKQNAAGQEGYFPPTSESELPEEDEEMSDVEEEDREEFEVAAAKPPPINLPISAKYDPGAPSPATTDTSHSLGSGVTSPAMMTASPLSGIPPRLNSIPTATRQGSMATVRLKRKARLAEKLREVFGLKQVEEVVAEMPCWLLRSVLLQGYMYLTTAHLCFFAHMPAREVSCC